MEAFLKDVKFEGVFKGCFWNVSMHVLQILRETFNIFTIILYVNMNNLQNWIFTFLSRNL